MMSKRINELAFKYHIDARTDELSLFVSEIYDDGFHAGKQAQQAFNTKIELRDTFAGLAMQGYLSGYYSGGGEDESTDFVLRLKAIADKSVGVVEVNGVDIDHQILIGYPLNNAEITTIKNKVMMMYGVDQDD